MRSTKERKGQDRKEIERDIDPEKAACLFLFSVAKSIITGCRSIQDLLNTLDKSIKVIKKVKKTIQQSSKVTSL